MWPHGFSLEKAYPEAVNIRNGKLKQNCDTLVENVAHVLKSL